VCDGFQLFIVIFYNVLRFIFPYTGALRWYYTTVCLTSQGTLQLGFFRPWLFFFLFLFMKMDSCCRVINTIWADACYSCYTDDSLNRRLRPINERFNGILCIYVQFGFFTNPNDSRKRQLFCAKLFSVKMPGNYELLRFIPAPQIVPFMVACALPLWFTSQLISAYVLVYLTYGIGWREI
jgi:hypothetical protein